MKHIVESGLLRSFYELKRYCEKEQFKGWDPYDGLSSKLFKVIPFIKSTDICRLIFIQFFKRCPVNLRSLALVPKEYNTKGIGLFLQGYCNLYKAVCNNPEYEKILGTKEQIVQQMIQLADLLLELQSKGYSGACWGYSFDWQSKAFFLPAHTPTVVATSFVVEALINAYEIIGNEKYLEVAGSSTDFILNDLNRIEKKRGFMFSYSPLDNRAVYNASLLGTKTLSIVYHYTHDERLKKVARETALAVCDVQNADGSFPHSDQIGNNWRDSFHTGFKLESLAIYQKYCNDTLCDDCIEHGYKYWIDNFFISEKGIAKYYDTSSENDLIDLHCVAQSIPTLFKLNKLMDNIELVRRLVNWSIENMQDENGYFYFQKKGNSINRIPYMRWPNAWMFYGLSYLILFDSKDE